MADRLCPFQLFLPFEIMKSEHFTSHRHHHLTPQHKQTYYRTTPLGFLPRPLCCLTAGLCFVSMSFLARGPSFCTKRLFVTGAKGLPRRASRLTGTGCFSDGFDEVHPGFIPSRTLFPAFKETRRPLFPSSNSALSGWSGQTGAIHKSTVSC